MNPVVPVGPQALAAADDIIREDPQLFDSQDKLDKWLRQELKPIYHEGSWAYVEKTHRHALNGQVIFAYTGLFYTGTLTGKGQVIPKTELLEWIYYGEIHDGLPHGRGVKIWPENGASHRGIFDQNNLMTGLESFGREIARVIVNGQPILD